MEKHTSVDLHIATVMDACLLISSVCCCLKFEFFFLILRSLSNIDNFIIMLFNFDTATALGLPLLSPYLQSVGSNYGHGANFAASGATANDINSFIAPISLPVQINQFKIFKQQVMATISAHGN